MTNFLISYFIKDQNVKDSRTREKYSMLASAVGVFANGLLFTAKLIIGISLGSVAIMADSFNNLFDSLVSIISFVGIKMGNKPADSDHPFGHGRVEYFSTLFIAVSIIALGFGFLRSSVLNIFEPPEIGFDLVSVSILVFAALMKAWLVIFYKKVGKIIDSRALIATAKDSLNDIIITVSTIISIVFTSSTGVIIDGYIGVVVSGLLMYSGYGIAKDAVSKLMGESIDPELAQKIKSIAESYSEVLDTHDLIVHNYGPTNSMATIHVEISNKMSVDAAHTLVDQIERRVRRDLGITLVTHVDPMSVNDDRVKEIKSKVLKYINVIDEELGAHEFKIVKKTDSLDVMFELVFPHEYTQDEENTILVGLSFIVESLDKKYNCIIEPKYKYIKDE